MAKSDTMPQSQQALMVTNFFSGPAASLHIGLNKNSGTPNPLNAGLATILEPTGSWYSRPVTTSQSIISNADGSLSVNFSDVQFTYSGSSSPETIQGYFVCYGTGLNSTVIAQNSLPAPVVMATSLNGILVSPVLTYPTVQVQQS